MKEEQNSIERTRLEFNLHHRLIPQYKEQKESYMTKLKTAERKLKDAQADLGRANQAESLQRICISQLHTSIATCNNMLITAGCYVRQEVVHRHLARPSNMVFVGLNKLSIDLDVLAFYKSSKPSTLSLSGLLLSFSALSYSSHEVVAADALVVMPALLPACNTKPLGDDNLGVGAIAVGVGGVTGLPFSPNRSAARLPNQDSVVSLLLSVTFT